MVVQVRLDQNLSLFQSILLAKQIIQDLQNLGTKLMKIKASQRFNPSWIGNNSVCSTSFAYEWRWDDLLHPIDDFVRIEGYTQDSNKAFHWIIGINRDSSRILVNQCHGRHGNVMKRSNQGLIALAITILCTSCVPS